jgi:hypothetical protein
METMDDSLQTKCMKIIIERLVRYEFQTLTQLPTISVATGMLAPKVVGLLITHAHSLSGTVSATLPLNFPHFARLGFTFQGLLLNIAPFSQLPSAFSTAPTTPYMRQQSQPRENNFRL